MEATDNLSLVKRDEATADGNALEATVFSGSNARTVRIALAPL